MGERQTRIDRLVFSVKVVGLRAKRSLLEWRQRPVRWPQTSAHFSGERMELRSALFVDGREEERAYEVGKVENLRVAIVHLDGVEIPAGEVFSFWRQVGKATTGRGFVRGRMLQAGCVVPAIGGGLCQLSNALYELALRTGCEIVERHGHSHRLPGTPLRDATVAWNYIDLRFRPKLRTRIEVGLSQSELVAAFVCDGSIRPWHRELKTFSGKTEERPGVQLETCATCSETNCSRHEQGAKVRSAPRP